MEKHLCVQCKYYRGSDGPNGQCEKLAEPVWSRLSQCTAHPLDLFEPLDTLSNKLRTAREAIGKSRKEVCIDLEIPIRTLQNWETDKNKPPARTVKMLLDYYGINKPEE